MGQTTTNLPLNLDQLAAELGEGVRTRTTGGVTTVIAEGKTKAELDAAIAAHVVDADFGQSEEDRAVRRLRNQYRAKARQVLLGNDSFNAAEREEIIARLVLIVTR